MSDSIGTLFFKDKQVRLILALSNAAKEWHLSDLSKEANVTYIHTSKFISKCEQYGIVATEKHGRIKRVYLTEKGKEMARILSGAIEKVKSPEAPQAQKAPQQPAKPQEAAKAAK